MNNNNRNNNNRRRGRGNRPQGGGSQGNRIDSRARGNAPQMLDKFKKLAQDAQHNGDRVQAEYYLQFADHYFRVIADNRTRQDDPRARREDREQEEFDGEDEDMADDRRRYDLHRERPRQGEPQVGPRNGQREGPGGESTTIAANEGPAFEPGDNPFTRDTRGAAEGTPPGADRQANEDRGRRRPPRPRRPSEDNRGIDAAVLPPSISANDADDGDGAEATTEAPPRRRRKRNEGGTLSAVG